jgi:hypothetical protein
MFVIAETEHARSEQLDSPESIYRACADMQLFSQEAKLLDFSIDVKTLKVRKHQITHK